MKSAWMGIFLGLLLSVAARARGQGSTLLKDVKRSVKNSASYIPLIEDSRKTKLKDLAAFLSRKVASSGHADLVFISTDNAARSQLAEVMFNTCLIYSNLQGSISVFSGGKTSDVIPSSVVKSLNLFGFQTSESADDGKQRVRVVYSRDGADMTLFSKKYTDASIHVSDPIYVITCNLSQEGCPDLKGPFTVELDFRPIKSSKGNGLDPAYQDDTSRICAEMLYVTQLLKKSVK